MNRDTVLENLNFLAIHAENEASRIESELWHPAKGNIQSSAPEVLRKRAARYRAARAEMLRVLPRAETPRAPRKVRMWAQVGLVVSAALAGAVVVLLFVL